MDIFERNSAGTQDSGRLAERESLIFAFPSASRSQGPSSQGNTRRTRLLRLDPPKPFYCNWPCPTPTANFRQRSAFT